MEEVKRDEPGSVACSGCGRVVDEFEVIAEKWMYWSDGTGDLLPFCPECAERENGHRKAVSPVSVAVARRGGRRHRLRCRLLTKRRRSLWPD